MNTQNCALTFIRARLCFGALKCPQTMTRCLALAFSLIGVCPDVCLLAEDQLASELNIPIESQRNVVFREVGRTKIKADLFRPRDDKTYPLVMMVHGGGWTAGDKWDLLDHGRELAQAGFVAVSINYRLSPKVKIDAQVDDCRYAMKWAVENSKAWNADAQRFGLWGYSAGAHLISMLALRPEDGEPKILAAVAGGAPCEFSFVPEKSVMLAHVMGGSRSAKPEMYDLFSPLNFASKQSPPFFLFHGTTDFLVPRSSSKMLFETLQELKVESEYYDVEGKGHLLTFLDRKARRRAIEFLQKHLKDES